jgi:hypothetical protein
MRVSRTIKQFLGDRPVTTQNTLRQRRDVIDDETRQQFAIRANGILAFVDCDPEKRARLREEIVSAMLWAQTQR